MKKIIKLFFKYCEEIIKTYIGVIAFVPWIYDNLQAYFPLELQFTFSSWFIYSFLISSIFLSGFIVWRKEKMQNQSCVDYTIECNIEKFSQIDTDPIRKEIEDYEKKQKQSEKQSNINMLSQKTLYPFLKDDNSYLNDLKAYFKQAEQYNKEVQDICRLQLNVKNIGSIYDEKIKIVLLPSEDTEIISDEQRYEFEHLPEKPEREKMSWLHNANMSSAILNNDIHTEKFRDVIVFSKDYIEVELKDLRPTDMASIIYDGIVIRGEKFNFDVEIISKGLKKPLKLTVQSNSK